MNWWKAEMIKQREREWWKVGVRSKTFGTEEEEEREKKGGLVLIYHSDSWPCGWPWDLTASSSALIFLLLSPVVHTFHFSDFPLHFYHLSSRLLSFFFTLSFLKFSFQGVWQLMSPHAFPGVFCFFASCPFFHHSNKAALRMHELHRRMRWSGHPESRT